MYFTKTLLLKALYKDTTTRPFSLRSYSRSKNNRPRSEHLVLFLSGARDNVVNAQDEAGGLDGGLEGLGLHTVGLPDS